MFENKKDSIAFGQIVGAVVFLIIASKIMFGESSGIALHVEALVVGFLIFMGSFWIFCLLKWVKEGKK